MPRLLCPNGHEYHFRNTRGSRGAGRACPDCGETLRAPTAYQCNVLGLIEVESWMHPGRLLAARGKCTKPKGHDGAHEVRGRPFVVAA